MPANAELLIDLPLFSSLTDQERGVLAEAVNTVSLPAGKTLFRVGDPGKAMYMVVSGEMEISVTDHAGQKIVLTVARHGDFFGELALVDAAPRSATAIALEECELIELDRHDLLLMVTRQPESALHLLGAVGAMTRKADLLLRTRVVRNPNEEIAEKITLLQQIADWIAAFSGSMEFLMLNIIWFGVWIGLNVMGIWTFDPYPFGLLTMIVSLQAIFLSIFLLLAQNRQAVKDRIRADVEYEINVKAELEVAYLHDKVDSFREDFLDRMERLEATLSGKPKA